ncbi:MAG: SufS family cysteine desulfurase [Clostridia bacterium]|nr:SufS family cysteine desulfurase [Clostridia bacterium]
MNRDIRADFPLIQERKDIAYLDSAATAQKPACVIQAEGDFYRKYNANPLRGLYELSQEATAAYENAREKVRAFLGAESTEEIIFTRNTSESMNLIAYSYGSFLQAGDEILVSIVEHHSNFLPWQMAAERAGARIRFLECEADGSISEEAFRAQLNGRTRIVAMTQLSNVLGREYPIQRFAQIAHEAGAIFVCDGAQSVPHLPVNVGELGVDFLAFSGHKMCGPMGIGVLYGRKELLEKMPPFLRGGEMIEYVTRDGATWAELPHKFEAGTVNAAGAAGLAAAIDYYNELGFEWIQAREEALSRTAMEALRAVPHLELIGAEKAEEHHGIFTFTMEGVHPHDIAEILSSDGVCIRAGHHCAQPLMQHLGVRSTVRASIMFYNTEEEIHRLAESLRTVRGRMGYAE